MEKIWKFISLSLFIVLIVLFFLNFNNYKVENRNKHVLNYNSWNFDVNCKMTGQSVNDSIYDYIEELAFLKSPLLIFRYSDMQCKPCFEKSLELIRETFDSTAQVLIVNSHKTDRDFKIFKMVNQIVHKNYLVPYGVFDWEIEKYGTPYFFILNTNNKISNIFIPDIKYYDQTLKYLESMKRLLSEDNPK